MNTNFSPNHLSRYNNDQFQRWKKAENYTIYWSNKLKNLMNQENTVFAIYYAVKKKTTRIKKKKSRQSTPTVNLAHAQQVVIDNVSTITTETHNFFHDPFKRFMHTYAQMRVSQK